MINHALSMQQASGSALDIGDRYAYGIHEIIRAGWDEAQSFEDVNPQTPEVRLNHKLRLGMCEVVNGEAKPLYSKITVLPGTESRFSEERPTPDGLTDIPIFLTDIREKMKMHNPHAIIECKRVSGSDTDLCRYYVVEGMDRFRVGKYASEHVMGFMAGYVISGSVVEAIEGVNKYLNNALRLADCLEKSTIFDANWALSSSIERENSKQPIVLHHAFLEFDLTSNSSN